jgi:hypothetical protein
MNSDSKTSEHDPLVVVPKPQKKPFLWQSGCFRLDPRFTLFACQFIITFAIVALCVEKLLHDDSCETQSFYGNILTTMAGIWLPSPFSAK